MRHEKASAIPINRSEKGDKCNAVNPFAGLTALHLYYRFQIGDQKRLLT